MGIQTLQKEKLDRLFSIEWSSHDDTQQHKETRRSLRQNGSQGGGIHDVAIFHFFFNHKLIGQIKCDFFKLGSTNSHRKRVF